MFCITSCTIRCTVHTEFINFYYYYFVGCCFIRLHSFVLYYAFCIKFCLCHTVGCQRYAYTFWRRVWSRCRTKSISNKLYHFRHQFYLLLCITAFCSYLIVRTSCNTTKGILALSHHTIDPNRTIPCMHVESTNNIVIALAFVMYAVFSFFISLFVLLL